jgi:hypothetical protein
MAFSPIQQVSPKMERSLGTNEVRVEKNPGIQKGKENSERQTK